jgi:hypothetical protein
MEADDLSLFVGNVCTLGGTYEFFQYYNEKSLAEISWQLCDEIVIDNPSVVVVAFIRNANRAVIQNEQHCICFTERGMCITRSRTPAGWHVTFREIL